MIHFFRQKKKEFLLLIICICFPLSVFAGEVSTKGAVLVSKVAPGDLLPVTVQLVNFGSSKRVDVDILYQIRDQDDNVVLTERETVVWH